MKSLAKKYIKWDKKKSILLFITILLATMMISLFFSVALSPSVAMKKMANYMPQITIVNEETEKIEKLSEDDAIQRIVTIEYFDQMMTDSVGGNLLYIDNLEYFDSLEGEIPEQQNEVLIENSVSKMLHKEIGDTIEVELSNGDTEEFIISAVAKREMKGEQANIYVSKEYRNNHLGSMKIRSAMIFLKEQLNEADVIEIIHPLGEQYDIDRLNMSVYQEYFDYSDTGLNSKEIVQMIVIALIILFASSLVIYSTYYISVNANINEYGKLRSIGMSIKQVKKLILKEAQLLALPASLIGSLLGLLISFIINSFGFSIKNYLIVGFVSVLFGLIVTMLSAMKPAKFASGVSPIEAERYSTFNVKDNSSHSVSKKVSPRYLGVLNLKRDFKKTIFTIISLSLCGVFFLIISGVFTSLSTEDIARNQRFLDGEYKFEYEGTDINKQNLIADANNFGKAVSQGIDNPIDEALKSRMQMIEGVDDVVVRKATTVLFDMEGYDVNNQVTTIQTYQKNDIGRMNKSVIEGSIPTTKDRGLVVNITENTFEDVYHVSPKIGDTILLKFWSPDNKIIEEEFEIKALTSNDGFSGIFRIPEEVLEEISHYNTNYEISARLYSSIESKKDVKLSVENHLRLLSEEYPQLSLHMIDDYVEQLNRQYSQGIMTIMVFVVFLLLFAIFNLFNLTITNYIERKNQMGMMLAVGLTRKQLKYSRVIENEIIILSATLLSTIFGIIVGKVVTHFLQGSGIIERYNPPIVFILGYIAFMLIIGWFLEVIIGFMNRKETLIDYIND